MLTLRPALRDLVLLILLTALGAGCASLPAEPTPAPLAPVSATPPPAPASATATRAVPTPAATQPPTATLLPAATRPPTATATPPPTARPTPTPSPTPDTSPLRLSRTGGVPQVALEPVLEALRAAGLSVEVAPPGPALTGDLQLVEPGTQEGAPAWEWVFTLAAPMSSLLDSIPLSELAAVWTGAGRASAFTSVYATSETVMLLTPLLGRPGPDIKTAADDALASAVWRDPKGIAVVPFEALGIGLRAIKVDGRSPVDNRFVPAEWPLTARASLTAATDRGEAALSTAAAALPATNRDADRLTVLVMTGVTAMARHSAGAIERSGDDGFLARVVGGELAAADITIISNEIPFATACEPDERANALVLCSKYEYWENLELSGVDAIGLSGNHLNDFGRKELFGTLAFYKEKKVPYYGGGANAEEALAPLIVEHNGNRLGFMGANQHGPVVAWAGPETPGSARFELKTMQSAIAALKPHVDLVFAEVQHLETNYQGEYVNVPNSGQEYDFKGLNDAGADVVTGVMAHAPQAVEIRNGRLILYGLGNLYFDQTWSWPTRTGLVARHTIYDGRLVNTELLVTVIEMNWQLRWATPEERAQVLKSIYGVSRWPGR